jgi:hypothetical protein
MRKFLYDRVIVPLDVYLHGIIDETPAFSCRNRVAGFLHGQVHEAAYLFRDRAAWRATMQPSAAAV